MEPFSCPQCHALLLLPDHYAGRRMPCPGCQVEIWIPSGRDRPGTEQAQPPPNAGQEQRPSR